MSRLCALLRNSNVKRIFSAQTLTPNRNINQTWSVKRFTRNLASNVDSRDLASNVDSRFLDYDTPNNENYLPENYHDEFHGLNLKHGKYGVFDIEDLVATLKFENARNIVVLKVDATLNYVDYLAVCECKSPRHMRALSEYILKVYKKKRNGEMIPKIEGKESNDWVALDLGNIAVHIFSKKAREKYDIEMLWAVGREFDPKSQEEVPEYVKIIERFNKERAN